MIPSDNMVISEDTTFSTGVYLLPKGIRIERNDITLDGNGAVLVGENFSGCGIFASYRDNITIKNISLQGYRWGVRVEDSNKLAISNCDIKATHEITANTIFLDIWIQASDTYGSGILLQNVNRGQILDCDLSHQMNGLLSYDCDALEVKNNLANYCSGWGFHLNHTSNSLFENNTADYCCRYEPRGKRKGHMGADSAGFLIVNHSCNNKFLGNNARMGGDGFFLAGMNPDYEPVGCDNNLFEDNDASFSPNNAFEATFSTGNIFRSNIANNSNYGFWLGFSRDGMIEDNQILGNRQAGIAVENGINFTVRNNQISNNRHGILLWSKHVSTLEKGLPENTTSLNWRIEHNTFTGNQKAIRIAADQDHGVRPLPASGELGFPAPKPENHLIMFNKFEQNFHPIEEINTLHTTNESNEFITNTYE